MSDEMTAAFRTLVQHIRSSAYAGTPAQYDEVDADLIEEAASRIESLTAERDRANMQENCNQRLINDHLRKIMHLENRIEEESCRADALQKRFDKLDAAAYCGTTDNWTTLTDEEKRLWFALAIEESSRRKNAEAERDAAIAKAVELEKALKPFASIVPSTRYASDGSECEEYMVLLRNAYGNSAAFTGADLAAARAALASTAPTPAQIAACAFAATQAEASGRPQAEVNGEVKATMARIVAQKVSDNDNP